MKYKILTSVLAIAICLSSFSPALAIYDRPSKDTIASDFVATNAQRPKLLVNGERFSQIKAEYANSNTTKSMFEQAKKQADLLLQTSTPKAAPKVGNWSLGRNVTENMLTLGVAYYVTEDKVYAKRAIKELIWACLIKNWNTTHYLDVAEMAVGVGIGYDWFYEEMTPCEQRFIRKAIVRNALRPTLAHYRANSFNGKLASDNNWNTVINSGVATAAIAIMDDPEYTELASECISHALKNLEYVLAEYAPDGGWHEGLTYWDYSYSFHVYLASTMLHAFDTDYGVYSQVPGIEKTPYFLAYMKGSGGIFNIHDADNIRVSTPGVLWHAALYEKPDLTTLYLKQSEMLGDTLGAKELLWIDFSHQDTYVDTPKDALFGNVEIASFRTSWFDKNALCASIHGGANNAVHGQLDSGTFVLDALGERWVEDVGKDNYSLDGFWQYNETGKRWNYYVNRAEGHNTVVINPVLSADQRANAFSKITEFKGNYDLSYAVMDMTQAHRPHVSTALRGMIFHRPTNTVTIQDAITADKAIDFWWFVHTKSDIIISNDGKTATFVKNNKRLVLSILDGSNTGALFKKMDAVSLVRPHTTGQKNLSDYQKLYINISNASNINLAIGMRAYNNLDETPLLFPPLSPLSGLR